MSRGTATRVEPGTAVAAEHLARHRLAFVLEGVFPALRAVAEYPTPPLAHGSFQPVHSVWARQRDPLELQTATFVALVSVRHSHPPPCRNFLLQAGQPRVDDDVYGPREHGEHDEATEPEPEWCTGELGEERSPGGQYRQYHCQAKPLGNSIAVSAEPAPGCFQSDFGPLPLGPLLEERAGAIVRQVAVKLIVRQFPPLRHANYAFCVSLV